MSTFSPLKIELIGTGEQDGTWGSTTNVNLGTAIEEAITGSADVAFSSADVTLTLTDTNGSQTARNLRLNLTGTSGGARNLYVPAIEKFYLINNGLANTVTVINATGTGTAIPAGTSGLVYNTGTNVVNPISYFSGNAVITSGTINNTTIGATTASTGAFTTLTTSGNAGIGGAISGSYRLEVTGKAYASGGLIPRSLPVANTSGAITPASDTYDQVNYALTGSSSFSNPSGTPTNGQKLLIRLTAVSVQTISSWSSTSNGYRVIGVTLPTSVPAGKTLYVGCIWNSTDSFWDVVAAATQA
jgi:hypothetical protein